MLTGLQDAYVAAIAPDRKTLWVTCPAGNKIAVIDLVAFQPDGHVRFHSGKVRTQRDYVHAGRKPRVLYAMMLDSDPRKFYLAKFDAKTLILLSVKEMAKNFAIELGRPMATFTDTATGRGITVFDYPGFVLEYELDSPESTWNGQVPFYPDELTDAVMSPDGQWIYVADVTRDTVYVFETATLSYVTRPAVKLTRKGPRCLGVSPDGNYLFVGYYALPGGQSKMSMIRLSDSAVVSEADLGGYPRRIGVSPTGNRIYVTDYNTDTCRQYDVTGEKITLAAAGDLDIYEGTFANAVNKPNFLFGNTTSSLPFGPNPQASDYTLNASPIGVVVGDDAFTP